MWQNFRFWEPHPQFMELSFIHFSIWFECSVPWTEDMVPRTERAVTWTGQLSTELYGSYGRFFFSVNRKFIWMCISLLISIYIVYSLEDFLIFLRFKDSSPVIFWEQEATWIMRCEPHRGSAGGWLEIRRCVKGRAGGSRSLIRSPFIGSSSTGAAPVRSGVQGRARPRLTSSGQKLIGHAALLFEWQFWKQVGLRVNDAWLIVSPGTVTGWRAELIMTFSTSDERIGTITITGRGRWRPGVRWRVVLCDEATDLSFKDMKKERWAKRTSQ